MENILGLMVENIPDLGKTICFMELVCILGQTAGDTKVNTLTIRNTGKEFTHGPMVKNMMEAGRTASNMARQHLQILRAKTELDSGKTETESNGSAKLNNLVMIKRIKNRKMKVQTHRFNEN